MGRRVRLRRYSRRTANSGKGRRVLVITLAVLSFILLSVAVSVAAGLALGKMADGYVSPENSGELAVKDYYSGDKVVKAVEAHEYSWGLGTSYYRGIGITDFSVCLRDKDGFITYHSDVNVSFGESAGMGKRNLPDEVKDTQKDGGHVAAYFYSSAFEESDPYKREIKKAYEIALINEAEKSGIDDILIIGLAPTDENIDELEAFISDLSRAAEKSALGVLVSVDDVKLTDSGKYLVPRMRAVCDFTALDLREVQSVSSLKATLDEMEYYISSGSMRLVFSKNNSSFMKSAFDLGITSAQIVEE